MTIESLREEVVNTNENKMNEGKEHEKNNQKKPSIFVVLFSFFNYFELFFEMKIKNHLKIVFSVVSQNVFEYVKFF